jgi:hypothetical protein
VIGFDTGENALLTAFTQDGVQLAFGHDVLH